MATVLKDAIAAKSFITDWTMGDASGTTVADAIDSDPGTLTKDSGTGYLRAETSIVPSGEGTATKLISADGGRASITDASNLHVNDVFTVIAWVKRASTGSRHTIFSQGAGGLQFFIRDDDKLTLNSNNVDIIVQQSTGTIDTNPHFLVVTKNGATIHLYIDGVDNTGSIANRTLSSGTTANSIGRRAGFTDENMNGWVQFVALKGSAITSSDVLDLWYASQLPPTLASFSSANVTSSSADISGTVNPNNAPTTYYFEYGLTTSYGTQVPVAAPGSSAGSGSSPVSETSSLSGLNSSATYHWRMVAVSAAGTTTGADQTFTTSGPPITRAVQLPPLRLSVDVKTPDGRHARHGADETNPINVPSGWTFGDVAPGGFDTMDYDLPRKPGVAYNDLTLLSTYRVAGVGGDVAWEGRLERTPRSSGDQRKVTASCVGWQAHLEDNQTAKEIWRDTDLSHWSDASVAQQLVYNAGTTWHYVPIVGVEPDKTTGLPALHQQIVGAWGANDLPMTQAMYDSNGVILGPTYYSWRKSGYVPLSGTDGNWAWILYASTDDLLTSTDNTGDLQPAAGTSGTGTLSTTGSNKKFLIAAFWDVAAEGLANRDFSLYWQFVVYGNHGITVQGTEPSAGLLASDIIASVIQRFAPSLHCTTGAGGSIQTTTFAIPQLVHMEPTTPAQMIQDADRFEIADWAVWEGPLGPTFYYAPRGTLGRNWRARVGPAQLTETGPQSDRIWNGVMVQFQDVSGVTLTVGPTGSTATTTDSTLLDTDPLNPANQAGIPKWALLDMGEVSTVAGATRVGQRFLAESKNLDSSGSATLTGYVEDDKGVQQPYWRVRSGDTITFVDSHDTSARRIVSTSKDVDSRSCSVNLDAPPDGLSALLDRLGVVLTPLGL